MAGRRRPRQDWPQRLEQNHCWSLPQHDQTPSLAGALVHAIGLCSELADCNPVLVERLQIDEQVYRLLAAMVIPELGQGDHLDRLQQRQRHGRDSFDELIDYILANLHQPLNLTILEACNMPFASDWAARPRNGSGASGWIWQGSASSRPNPATAWPQLPTPAAIAHSTCSGLIFSSASTSSHRRCCGRLNKPRRLPPHH
jgi:hypothetical protein